MKTTRAKYLYRRAWKKRLFIAISLATIALFVLFASLRLAAGAQINADVVHTLSYTQADLARLVERASFEAPVKDFSFINEYAGQFDVGEDGVLRLKTGQTYEEYIAQQLEGKLYLDTIVDADGCVAVLALDIGNIDYSTFNPETAEGVSLVVIGINPTDAYHAFDLQVEQLHDMSAEVTGFDLTPISWVLPEEEDEDDDAAGQNDGGQSETESEPGSEVTSSTEPVDSAPEDSSSVESQPDSETPSENQPEETPVVPETPADPPADPPAADEGAAQAFLDTLRGTLYAGGPLFGEATPPASEEAPADGSGSDSTSTEPPASSSDSSQVADSSVESDSSLVDSSLADSMIVEEPVVPTEALEAEFALEQNNNEVYETVPQGVALVLAPNGVGTLRLNSGAFNGGALNEIPFEMNRPAQGEAAPLAAAAAAGTPGAFTLHMFENSAMLNTASGVYYTIDSSTAIEIPGTEAFSIDLHNNVPVVVQSVSAAAANLTITSSDEGADATSRLLVLDNSQQEAHALLAKNLAVDNVAVTAKGAASYIGSLDAAGRPVDGENGMKNAVHVTSNMYLSNGARLEGNSGTYGVYVAGLLVADNVPGQYGFADENNLDDSARTRVFGKGNYAGIEGGMVVAARGATVYGEGGVTGVYVGSAPQNVGANATGMNNPALDVSEASRQGGTIMGVSKSATPEEGAGITVAGDAHFSYQKVISRGGCTGLLLDLPAGQGSVVFDTGSEADLTNDYAGIRIEGGDTAGALVVQNAFGGEAAKVYARGKGSDNSEYGNVSRLAGYGLISNRSVTVQDGAVLVAIGGMQNDLELAASNELDGLAVPVLAGDWLMPASTIQDSAGISLRDGAVLLSQGNESKIYAYGYDGIVANASAVRIDMNYGYAAGAGSKALIKAFGRQYGIHTQGQTADGPAVGIVFPGASEAVDLTNEAYRGYMLGAGHEAGIFAEDGNIEVSCGYVVGETSMEDGKAALSVSGAGYHARAVEPVAGTNCSTLLDVYHAPMKVEDGQTTYYTDKVEGTELSPFALTDWVETFTQQLGAGRARIDNYRWTAPSQDLPARATDGSGFDYIQYSSSNGAGRVDLGGTVEQYGFITDGPLMLNEGDALIGSYTGTAWNDDNYTIAGPQHRIVILGGYSDNTENLSMALTISLKEMESRRQLTAADIPQGTQYTLEYLAPGATQSTFVNLCDPSDLAVGEEGMQDGFSRFGGYIELKALKAGDYWLTERPGHEIGEPFEELPRVHFVIEREASEEEPGKFLLVVSVDPGQDTAEVTESGIFANAAPQARARSGLLAASSGNGTSADPVIGKVDLMMRMRALPDYRGQMLVKINVRDLWAGFDDTVFLVEAKGISGNAEGCTFYETGVVNFPNLVKPYDSNFNPNNHQAAWNSHIQSYYGSTSNVFVTFRNMPSGTYTVTVYPGLRCEIDSDTATKTIELRWNGGTSSNDTNTTQYQNGVQVTESAYNFKCTNFNWMSGGSARSNRAIRTLY